MDLAFDDILGALEATTAEMATADMTASSFDVLMRTRRDLIERLAVSGADPRDPRLAAAVAGGERIQQRLRQRAQSIRGEIANLASSAMLLNAMNTTLQAPKRRGIEISA